MLFPQTRDCGCGCLRCLNAQTKSDMKRQLAGERLPTREIRRIPQGCGSPALYLWSAAGGCRTTNAKLVINGDSLSQKRSISDTLHPFPFRFFPPLRKTTNRAGGKENCKKKSGREKRYIVAFRYPNKKRRTFRNQHNGTSKLQRKLPLSAALLCYCYVLSGSVRRVEEMLTQR